MRLRLVIDGADMRVRITPDHSLEVEPVEEGVKEVDYPDVNAKFDN